MTDYEIEFQNNESACGEPFAEIESFFAMDVASKMEVLDLGCGQGRDALMAANYGHRVLGVDIAPTGIKQMVERAATCGLSVTGEVADISEFVPSKKYDVVILDRVLHMLAREEDKNKLLEKAASCTTGGGYVFLVDTPKNIPTIEEYFDSSSDWNNTFNKKGFRFYQKSKTAA